MVVPRVAGRLDRSHRRDPAGARPGRLRRPVRIARPELPGPARSVRDGGAEERGAAVPALRRTSRNRADRLGPDSGDHQDRRLSRAGLPGRGRSLVRRGDADPRGAAATGRRPGARRPAGQRDRHAGLGLQLPRSDRPRAGGSAGLVPDQPRISGPQALSGGPRRPEGVAECRRVAGRGLGRRAPGGSRALHAGPIRPLRRPPRDDGAPARDRRRTVHDQRARHRGRQRCAVRDRGQPALPDVRPRWLRRRIRPLSRRAHSLGDRGSALRQCARWPR